MGSRRGIVLAVAFASGAAALLYQVVWMRWFQVLFGSTAYAASATLSAFFAGLAIGSELFGRRSSTVRRPLFAYALLEGSAALLALVVPIVFQVYDAVYPMLYGALAETASAFVLTKFALAMIAMLPPAILLGGSLPMLASAIVSEPASIGREGNRLYAINTFGAALGSAAGALWLPDWVGVRATYGLAIGLSAVAASVSLALDARRVVSPTSADGRHGGEGTEPVATASVGARDDPPALRLRAVAFASGFGTLALEVLLIQAIAQRLDHSVYSFGAVLFVVLICLAAGAEVVARTTRWVRAEVLLGLALLFEAVLLLVLPAMIARYQLVSEAGGLLRGLDAAFWLGAPALFVGALVLPLTFRMVGIEGGGVGRKIGGLLAINTLGGIVGSLVASFVLLSRLGLMPSIALVGVGYGAAALLTATDRRSRVFQAAVVALAIAAVLASPLAPGSLPKVVLEPGDRLVAVQEGAYGVVSVIDRGNARLMKINNHYTLSGAGPLGSRKERTGHLPLLLHRDPKRVLFVGSATGHTAGAAVMHPVEEIVLVEIVPEVQQLASELFVESNRGVHHDPRTRLVVEDGRNHLRASDEHYDVIVADLFSPWRPGVGSLYSREHFLAVRDRLAPGGVFCQWLPMYQHREETFATVAATFLEVFPDAQVFRGDFYQTIPRVALVGFNGDPAPVTTVNQRVRALAQRDVTDRWVTIPRAFWMLHVGPLAGVAARLTGYAPTSDDHPHFEYLAGRTRAEEIHAFLNRSWPEMSREVTQAATSGAGPYRDAAAAVRDGADLLRLNVLEQSPRRERHLSEIQAIRARLPEPLLRVPDPTAAEMWAR